VDPTSAVAPGRTGAFQRLTAPQNIVGQALTNLNPRFSLQLRATWEAINNAWSQRILNYTQGRQLNLLKEIGFQSPGWQDLSYVLIGIIVVVSLLGALWGLWERTQHDPWLRLLGKARKRLAKAGVDSTAATSPRQLAALLQSRLGSPRGDSTGDLQRWLMQLEAQRYAQPASG